MIEVTWLNQNSSSRNFDPLSPSIKLMTMHTSKGLEFPVVFIPGLGYLPNVQGEIADEARLLYVAMTRAIEVLVLTGDRKSEFVERLKEALVRVFSDRFFGGWAFGGGWWGVGEGADGWRDRLVDTAGATGGDVGNWAYVGR